VEIFSQALSSDSRGRRSAAGGDISAAIGLRGCGRECVLGWQAVSSRARPLERGCWRVCHGQIERVRLCSGAHVPMTRLSVAWVWERQLSDAALCGRLWTFDPVSSIEDLNRWLRPACTDFPANSNMARLPNRRSSRPYDFPDLPFYRRITAWCRRCVERCAISLRRARHNTLQVRFRR